jgi:hypothetical protein
MRNGRCGPIRGGEPGPGNDIVVVKGARAKAALTRSALSSRSMSDKQTDELVARVKALEEALAEIKMKLRKRIALALLDVKPAEKDGAKG